MHRREAIAGMLEAGCERLSTPLSEAKIEGLGRAPEQAVFSDFRHGLLNEPGGENASS
jgi:hypothetical protein